MTPYADMDLSLDLHGCIFMGGHVEWNAIQIYQAGINIICKYVHVFMFCFESGDFCIVLKFWFLLHDEMWHMAQQQCCSDGSQALDSREHKLTNWHYSFTEILFLWKDELCGCRWKEKKRIRLTIFQFYIYQKSFLFTKNRHLFCTWLWGCHLQIKQNVDHQRGWRPSANKANFILRSVNYFYFTLINMITDLWMSTYKMLCSWQRGPFRD